ncbi:MAG TPA: bifunctional phosphoribosyl-AMP cyclohydrolase/phosphoribosyl-ATP diphosphatase HisIE [Firmicutes bacterium]|nr:bifunctional phosphoribosyl-AMP cyclohydrolase/phosphoribosyl-ATP diphosphatase HisIE [Bacillota bacterium]
MIKYDENGLVPAIIQDTQGRVLMMAYMNEEAFNKTLQTGETWFYSRKRKQVWKKGAESGNVQKVRRITADCDRDTVLITVDQHGHGACDDDGESYTCFHNLIMSDGPDQSDLLPQREALSWLYASIEDRRRSPKVGSYTNYLMDNGLDKILKAFGEEAVEVIIAGKNQSDEELVYEVSDLLYHLLVLLVFRRINLEAVWEELLGRSSLSGH